MLLGRNDAEVLATLVRSGQNAALRSVMILGATILVTGAGGSIGSALARGLAGSGCHSLILLDHSEHNLYRIQAELSATRGCVDSIPILGDICDGALLAEVLEEFHPNVIFHSAAFKHVPLMEANPLAAIRNNALGTFTLAKTALEQKTPKLVMISTDKAVNPRSVMGVSKRIAELILTRLNSSLTQMKAIRLGNVLGSEGSVVPLFREQISRGGPVIVTDPNATRYFLTMSQTVEMLLTMDALETEGGIFVPVMGEPVSVLDLARRLVEEAKLRSDKNVPIVFTKLRPGDKMTEELKSENEFLEATADPRLHRICDSRELPSRFDAMISELIECVNARDVAALLEIVTQLVPEYYPSDFLLGSLNRSVV